MTEIKIGDIINTPQGQKVVTALTDNRILFSDGTWLQKSEIAPVVAPKP